VFLNRHAPLKVFGERSTAAHALQSIIGQD